MIYMHMMAEVEKHQVKQENVLSYSSSYRILICLIFYKLWISLRLKHERKIIDKKISWNFASAETATFVVVYKKRQRICVLFLFDYCSTWLFSESDLIRQSWWSNKNYFFFSKVGKKFEEFLKDWGANWKCGNWLWAKIS